jgi:hypothetical protein
MKNTNDELFITDDDNNARKIFIDDCQYKKLVAHRSIKSKKRNDLSQARINKLKGVVVVSNIYDEVMDLKSFKSLHVEEKKKAMKAYLERFSEREICNKWGRKKGYLYAIRSRIDPVRKKVENKQEVVVAQEIAPQEVTTIETPRNKDPLLISVTKELSGEKIQDFILKFVELLDANNKIKIEFNIRKLLPSKFAFSIDVNDEFKVNEFINEILDVVQSIPKLDMYSLYMQAIEIKEL